MERSASMLWVSGSIRASISKGSGNNVTEKLTPQKTWKNANDIFRNKLTLENKRLTEAKSNEKLITENMVISISISSVSKLPAGIVIPNNTHPIIKPTMNTNNPSKRGTIPLRKMISNVGVGEAIFSSNVPYLRSILNIFI